MKKILINTREAMSKVLPEIIKKDLQDNERICPACHGLGMVFTHRPYGIKGDTSPAAKANMFPYTHDTLTFCPDCYNGVQKLCEYCGEPLPRTRAACTCDGYLAEKANEAIKSYEKLVAKAAEIKESEVHTMLYCEENQSYYDSSEGFIEEWEDSHDITESVPEILWVTAEAGLSFDAANILESACEELHEDAIEACNITELQKILNEYAARQQGTKSYYPCYEQYITVKN